MRDKSFSACCMSKWGMVRTICIHSRAMSLILAWLIMSLGCVVLMLNLSILVAIMRTFPVVPQRRMREGFDDSQDASSRDGVQTWHCHTLLQIKRYCGRTESHRGVV